MMTPKEALIKDNETRPESERIPVKEGRGRMSRDAVERVKWLVINKGWIIKDYPAPDGPRVVSTSTAAPVEVKRVAQANIKEVKEFTIFYPEDSFKAVSADKKVWGMREVCNNCRVSLVQCQCGSPMVLGGVPVKIVPR